MDITNTHTTALGLPGGVTLEPNTPTPVHNWDEIKKNHVVAAWLKAGVLVEAGASAGAQGSRFMQADKDELLAKLAALGLHPDKRTGPAKLQAMLDEAEKSAGAAVTNVLQEAEPGSGPFTFQG